MASMTTYQVFLEVLVSTFLAHLLTWEKNSLVHLFLLAEVCRYVDIRFETTDTHGFILNA
jgi:hypothetical protein